MHSLCHVLWLSCTTANPDPHPSQMAWPRLASTNANASSWPPCSSPHPPIPPHPIPSQMLLLKSPSSDGPSDPSSSSQLLTLCARHGSALAHVSALPSHSSFCSAQPAWLAAPFVSLAHPQLCKPFLAALSLSSQHTPLCGPFSKDVREHQKWSQIRTGTRCVCRILSSWR